MNRWCLYALLINNPVHGEISVKTEKVKPCHNPEVANGMQVGPGGETVVVF